jgi:hypothetical protein
MSKRRLAHRKGSSDVGSKQLVELSLGNLKARGSSVEKHGEEEVQQMEINSEVSGTVENNTVTAAKIMTDERRPAEPLEDCVRMFTVQRCHGVAQSGDKLAEGGDKVAKP